MSKEEADFQPNNTKEKVYFSPKIFTTHPKSGKRHNKKKKLIEDSTAKSQLSSIERELGISGLFEGEVYHAGWDCPRQLGLLFKEATHANGTSICKELQKYALTYCINYVLEKKSFGSTLSRILKPKLTVENLNFSQYVQNRPRRLIRHVESEAVTAKGVSTCQIADCTNDAVGKGVFIKTKTEYHLCKLHFEAFLSQRDAWRLSA
jgi:hypothetical protein